MTNPASNIIEKCGGHQVVADMLQVDVSRVYRWTYPRDRGGSDGVIPAKHQVRLLAEAASRGLSLSPNDFFGMPGADGTPTSIPAAAAAAPPQTAVNPIAAIILQLGGRVVVAEGAGVSATDLDAMQAEGRIPPEHGPALTAFARTSGFDLDTAKLVMRARGKDTWRAA